MKLQSNYPTIIPQDYLSFVNSGQEGIALVFAQRLSMFFKDRGKKCIVASGYRDVVLQAQLYAENCRQYPPNGNGYVAKPGSSWHNGRCAIDIADESYWKSYMEKGDMERSVKNQELYKYGLCLPLNYVDGGTVFEWWHIQPIETLGYTGDRTKFLAADDRVYDPKVRPVVVIPKPVEVSKPMVTLKVGSNGQDVYEMQLMLNKLGFNCGSADGIFGSGTKTQVMAFQRANKLVADGVAGSVTLTELSKDFYEKCTTTGYRQVRDYGSTLHIYEASQLQDCDIILAPSRQKLSAITDVNKKIVCKVNGGFFNMLATNQDYLGLFIDEGKYYTPEGLAFLDFIYFKDGHSEIGRVPDLAKAAELQNSAKWAMGTSWSLIINGHICITNTQYFDHATQKHPRTMVGQRKNGSFVLVVAQGRGINEAGITAKQESELMFRLGCINAVNMDGGGSSEIIVNGQIMNKPTDGTERAVRACVCIYNK